MKRIKQLNKSGCGVACVAMIVGTTYAKALTVIFGDRHRKYHYTNTGDLRRALAQFGYLASPRLMPLRGRPFMELTEHAILKVNRHKHGWHWVVWDAERRQILDPHAKASGTYQAVSFLSVTKAPREATRRAPTTETASPRT